MFRFQTMSVIAGSEACNARCDFCISAMTPQNGVEIKHRIPDTSNLEVACRLAEKGGVTTALITGKGEPTLFPDDISRYLAYLPKYFPLVELQTNAIVLNNKENRPNNPDSILWRWRAAGLTTIIISVVHYDNDRNREIYCDQDGKYRFDYPDLATTISRLKQFGFSIRLSCVGCKGYIDTIDEFKNLIEFARANKVQQLTWRPVKKADNPRNDKVGQRTKELSTDKFIKKIDEFVRMNGTKLMELLHGATVYDVWGQNLCLSNCLTHSPDDSVIRQLIYFPDGSIRYDWQHSGAIIL